MLYQIFDTILVWFRHIQQQTWISIADMTLRARWNASSTESPQINIPEPRINNTWQTFTTTIGLQSIKKLIGLNDVGISIHFVFSLPCLIANNCTRQNAISMTPQCGRWGSRLINTFLHSRQWHAVKVISPTNMKCWGVLQYTPGPIAMMLASHASKIQTKTVMWWTMSLWAPVLAAALHVTTLVPLWPNSSIIKHWLHKRILPWCPALQWPCVTDPVLYPATNTMPQGRQLSTPPMPRRRNMVHYFTGTSDQCCYGKPNRNCNFLLHSSVIVITVLQT